MAVMVGKRGKITVGTSGTKEMYLSSWALNQPGPDLIDATKFQDEWKQYVPSAKDGGTVTISGNFDWESTGQQKMIAYFTSAINLTAASSFRLWMDDSTSTTGAGYFKFSTDCEAIIQTFNVGQDKSGLGTMDMTLKLTGGHMGYSTTT